MIGSTNEPAAIAGRFVTAVVDGDRGLLGELYYYGSILHHAASTTASDFVDRLLSLGADPNLRDKFGHTPLYSTCNGAGDVTIARALIAAGADVDAQDSVKRCAPLHMAGRRGHLDAAAALLDHGADLEVRDINGQTPLRRAVNCAKVERRHPAAGRAEAPIPTPSTSAESLHIKPIRNTAMAALFTSKPER